MGQDATPKTNNFVEAKVEERGPILQSLVQTKTQVFAWTEQQKVSVHGKVSAILESAGSLYVCLASDPEVKKFESELKRMPSQECFFSARLPTDLIFMRVELRRSDERGLHFKLLGSVYKAQRRASLRLPISGEQLALFVSPDSGEDIKAAIVDISEGGMSWVFQGEDPLKDLQVGELVNGVRFEISGRLIECSVEVRHRRTIGTTSANQRFKYGLRYSELSKEDQAFIADYLFEESSRYFGRI